MADRERYWRGVLEDWRASGLSRAAFCRRRGINYHTLGQWKSRIEAHATRSRGATQGTSEFVEVNLPTSGSSSQKNRDRNVRENDYEIVLTSGRSVRVPPGFEEADLTRLIRVTESC